MANTKGSKLLGNYLTANSLSHAEAAAAFGIDRQRIYRLISGERGPSVDLAFRIEDRTGGAVPAASWVSRRRPAA